MAYDIDLAAKVRSYLGNMPVIEIEEKKMFGGLAFMINGKMCVNVSGEQLMCRFDPGLTAQLSRKSGFLPMVMKGRKYKGYCYVDPIGYKRKKDFEFWINLCLDFNESARSSTKGKEH